MKKNKFFVHRVFSYAVLLLCAAIVLFPIVYTLCNSFMSADEITRYYSKIFESGKGFVSFHLVPDRITLDGFYQILLRRPDYLIKFWISLLLTVSIVAGQVVISCMGGYAFAKIRFPFKNAILFLFITLMMMPYQVTLVSNYIVLDKLGLIGSYAAIILPGIFSPFGVFFMSQVFGRMPNEVIEAAKLDGASHFRILRQIIVPAKKGGIVSLIVLSCVDNWNMVEQPLTFLKDSAKYPLSIFLAQLNSSNIGLSFACGILAMIPVTLLFVFFEKELVEGIQTSNLR